MIAKFAAVMHDELAAEIFENGRVASSILEREMDGTALRLPVHLDLDLRRPESCR